MARRCTQYTRAYVGREARRRLEARLVFLNAAEQNRRRAPLPLL